MASEVATNAVDNDSLKDIGVDGPNLVDEVLQSVDKEVEFVEMEKPKGSRESSPAAFDAAPPAPVPQKETSAKSKKKEDKSIEHILKALSSLQKPEEKLAALCKKYADLLEEHRLLQAGSKQSQKKLTLLMREKDQLQTEHSKAVLAKSKLESLCRELQRHNKLVKEESLARAREEEDKRKEVTSKFQTTITEIQQQMTENSTTNIKLREEKTELVTKIKTLMEKYELREQHFDKVLKQKEIEQQLADAKLAQSELKAAEQKQRHEKEKEILMLEATDAQKKVIILEEQEKQLRSQVALYTDKYEEFQDTLKKSNDVFTSFKSEMDKMVKKVKKLEKETTMWRTRWENSNKALLEMAEEKTKSDREMALLNSKIKKLESLCRALQQQRGLPAKAEDGGSPAVAAEADSSSQVTEAISSSSPAAAAAASDTSPAEDSTVSSHSVSSTSEQNGCDTQAATPSVASDEHQEAAPVSSSEPPPAQAISAVSPSQVETV